jgi:hypothetical protein
MLELGISGAQGGTQRAGVEIEKSPLFMRFSLENEQFARKCKNGDWYNNMLLICKHEQLSHNKNLCWGCKDAPKCNGALSKDLWPLDPFESALLRATSSVLLNSIPPAISMCIENKGVIRGHARPNRVVIPSC